MDDPQRALRARLGEQLAHLARLPPQADLFAGRHRERRRHRRRRGHLQQRGDPGRMPGAAARGAGRGGDPGRRQRLARRQHGHRAAPRAGRSAPALHRQPGQSRLRRGLQPGRGGQHRAVAGVRQSRLLRRSGYAGAAARCRHRHWATRWWAPCCAARTARWTPPRAGAIRTSRRCCARRAARATCRCRAIRRSRCSRWMRCRAR